jgi:hypothetical protein
MWLVLLLFVVSSTLLASAVIFCTGLGGSSRGDDNDSSSQFLKLAWQVDFAFSARRASASSLKKWSIKMDGGYLRRIFNSSP